MLIKFTDRNGDPTYINPQAVNALEVSSFRVNNKYGTIVYLNGKTVVVSETIEEVREEIENAQS